MHHRELSMSPCSANAENNASHSCFCSLCFRWIHVVNRDLDAVVDCGERCAGAAAATTRRQEAGRKARCWLHAMKRKSQESKRVAPQDKPMDDIMMKRGSVVDVKIVSATLERH